MARYASHCCILATSLALHLCNLHLLQFGILFFHPLLLHSHFPISNTALFASSFFSIIIFCLFISVCSFLLLSSFLLLFLLLRLCCPPLKILLQSFRAKFCCLDSVPLSSALLSFRSSSVAQTLFLFLSMLFLAFLFPSLPFFYYAR